MSHATPQKRHLPSSRTGGHRPRAVRLTALLAAAALAIAALSGCGASVPSAQTATLDKPVPATLVADDGSPAQVPVPGARSAVFHFWSPACEPCKRTIPAVVAKREEMQKMGAALVLVAVLDPGQTANDAKAALALWGIDERFVIDVEGAFFKKVGAKDVPAFAIVDSAGVLRWVAPDGVRISDVLAAIPE